MHECDLIMKGGITSGVAYPGAIVKLAERYRLRDIGGTSAGAIAAVLAAAAEYRRQHAIERGDGDAYAGFVSLERTGPMLAKDLASLFQPVPALRPLYRTLLAVAQAPPGRRLGGAVRGVLMSWRIPLALGLVPGLLCLVRADGAANVIAALFLLIILPALIVAGHVAWLVFRVLPRHDFGLCTGQTTAAGHTRGQKAFTDWIHERIESIAGARAKPGPLTVGDLAAHDIRVASMTTDLSSGRPWQLPLRAGVHHFSLAEFRQLFPADVVAWLVEKGEPSGRDSTPGAPADLHRLPDESDLPVILIARLSLSFPGLVSAVPLYRADTERPEGATAVMPLRRCLFSDGGISSNFPVHFFDGFLPSRPTFGIGFAAYDTARHGPDAADRVHLPIAPLVQDGRVRSIEGVADFVGAIVNTAKDWQDTLQSRLAGYSERIVEIRLDPETEGGLHVEMDGPTIDRLVGLGRLAAERIEHDFDFDEHRLRRALVLFATLEDALIGLAKAYPGTGESGLDYAHVLRGHHSPYFHESAGWRDDPLAVFAADLMRMGDRAAALRKDSTRRSIGDGRLPSRDADLRLVASPDTSLP